MTTLNKQSSMSWRLIPIALLPGIAEVLAAAVGQALRVPIPNAGVYGALIVSLLTTIAAAIWGVRHKAYPVWGLMALGMMAAMGVAHSIMSAALWIGLIKLPTAPGFTAYDAVSNTLFAAQIALVILMGILGTLRWLHFRKRPTLIAALVAAALIAVPLIGGSGSVIFSVYYFAAVGFSLLFADRYGSGAALVFLGILLGWINILDVDYALGMYFDQYWIIDVYNVVWRVLVFVISPLLLLTMPSRIGRLWGAVLPTSAALLMEAFFHALVKPYLLPESWLTFTLFNLLDPIALALALSVLLAEHPPRSDQSASPAPISAAQPQV